MAPDTHLPLAGRIRNRYLFASDALLFSSATVLSFALRFEGFEWGPAQNHAALLFLLICLPLKLAIFWRVGIYRRLWRYAGIIDIERLISASTASGLAGLLIRAVLPPGLGLTGIRAALQADVKTRTVPAMFDIISGKVTVGSLRRVEIQDLLRRETIQTDLEQVRGLATGETVLVTGAGGSIGSELCRQLARLEPAQ